MTWVGGEIAPRPHLRTTLSIMCFFSAVERIESWEKKEGSQIKSGKFRRGSDVKEKGELIFYDENLIVVNMPIFD